MVNKSVQKGKPHLVASYFLLPNFQDEKIISLEAQAILMKKAYEKEIEVLKSQTQTRGVLGELTGAGVGVFRWTDGILPSKVNLELTRRDTVRQLGLKTDATWAEVHDAQINDSRRSTALALGLKEDATDEEISQEIDRRNAPPPEDTRTAAQLAGDMLDALRLEAGEDDKAGQGGLATIREAEERGEVPPGTYARFLAMEIRRLEESNS